MTNQAHPPRIAPPPGWIVGIRIVAWWHVFLGALAIIIGVMQIPAAQGQFSPVLLVSTALFIITGMAFLVAGAAMLSFRGWGRVLALFLAILLGLLSIPVLMGGGVPIGVLHTLATVWFLTRRPVRQVFGV